ncbi:uncharacterized protein LOC131935164 [Physella acuta]|uniref:uncharacterized protein LOC131935164 n=1 Tax=Physella acuta TaxID=109671 RepID=UPI0027DE1EE3|nr:uncharacterized protein LOC131935164 [Physella acuta]
MDISDITVAGFQFGHLILAFLISAIFLFILYWLWTCPCREEEEPKSHRTILPAQAVKPLYALELEPGIVVLQSEDGEFFRILREYDSADRTGNGCKAPELPSCSSENRYIPSYTHAHYQTQPSGVPAYTPYQAQPSAPLLSDHDPGHQGPFKDGAGWAPIRISTPRY